MRLTVQRGAAEFGERADNVTAIVVHLGSAEVRAEGGEEARSVGPSADGDGSSRR